eukprot:TRINITY_DN12515_c0_g1_i1.p1 TRINITY_DN12515_c0_g1~~TRINITY_DN12515_c0_g1_i1.p1  ORF type:complete len:245 (+),score=34.59 TRINITY_DN12515_c0_g1_i1:74-808(+)
MKLFSAVKSKKILIVVYIMFIIMIYRFFTNKWENEKTIVNIDKEIKTEVPFVYINGRAPEFFRVKFVMTTGNSTFNVTRAWAPIGVDRFYELVISNYFEEIAFFRVVPGFVAQFGLHGNTTINHHWANKYILDDPVVKGNTRGYINYAMAGPNTRSNQFSIHYGDNSFLDKQNFPTFAVASTPGDMDAIDRINSKHLEKPSQGEIHLHGNAYLKQNFPGVSRSYGGILPSSLTMILSIALVFST